MASEAPVLRLADPELSPTAEWPAAGDYGGIMGYYGMRVSSHYQDQAQELGERAFSAAVPTLWNSLPAHIHDCADLQSFKARRQTSFPYCLMFSY